MDASQNIFRRSAILSVSLHVIVLASAVFGFLNYQTDVVDITQPLPVELVVEIDNISQSTDPTPPVKEKKRSSPKKIKTDPIFEKKVTETLPEPIDLKEPPQEKKVEELTLPLKMTELPKSKPKPPLTVKPQKKPQKKIKKKPRDFDALLKNLTKNTATNGGKGGIQSDHLAVSELDIVRKQIESVWRLPAGAQGAHQRSISIRIIMNPNRTVRSASLLNSSLSSDPGYRLLAESALRAVNEFKFKPLKLPPNKYKIWKEIRMNFDPRDLL